MQAYKLKGKIDPAGNLVITEYVNLLITEFYLGTAFYLPSSAN